MEEGSQSLSRQGMCTVFADSLRWCDYWAHVRTPFSANPGLKFNPSFFFFLSKALCRISFSILFRVSNHQIVGKANWTEYAFCALISEFKFRTNPGLYESLKSKFSLILFGCNLMIRYSKKIEKIIRESAFDNKKKKIRLKFNPGLALTGVRTTGPWSLKALETNSRPYESLPRTYNAEA